MTHIINRKLVVLVVLLSLVVFTRAFAADYQKAIEFYNKGDFASAAKDFQKLAEDNFGPAQEKIGLMYALGQGVPQSMMISFMWMKRAAENSQAQAQIILSAFYSEGKVVPQDLERAYMWAEVVDNSLEPKPGSPKFKIAKILTQDQIEVGKNRAIECHMKRYKNC